MTYAQWNPQQNYLVSDVVVDGIEPYIAVVGNTAKQPSLNTPAIWTLFNPPATPVVDSLNTATGALTLAGAGGLTVSAPVAGTITLTQGAPDAGQYHKNNPQTFSVLGGATPALTWQQATFAGSAITPVGGILPASQFLVNTTGLYSLEAQVQLVNINTATFTDPTVRLFAVLNRAGTSANILSTQFELTNAVPTNPAIDIAGAYLLNAGDILSFTFFYNISAGTFSAQAQSAAPAAFDLNTFWTWQLIKPLP
jgi:hypothetical protein